MAKLTPVFMQQSAVVPAARQGSCCVIASRELRFRNVESGIPDHSSC